MKQPLILLLAFLCATQSHAQSSQPAQPARLIAATWASGTNAYGCKWLADSLLQFYGKKYDAKTHAISVQLEPDGGLVLTDKGPGYTPSMGTPGDTMVYKEFYGHKYLIIYHKGRIREAWEALEQGETLDHFDTRYRTLYGLAGTYLDSATIGRSSFNRIPPS